MTESTAIGFARQEATALDASGRKRSRPIDVYLSADLDDYVRKLAHRSRTSVSAVCRDLLTTAIRSRRADTADATKLLSVLEEAMQNQTDLLRKLEVLGALNVSLCALTQISDELNDDQRRTAFAELILGGLKGAGPVLRSDAIAAVVRARSEG